MIVYAVDLGTTNVKVAQYDADCRLLAQADAPMTYRHDGDIVEFDPDVVLETVLRLIRQCAAGAGTTPDSHAVIVVTGQAESLVLVDQGGRPLGPGISWMDERSDREAREISDRLDPVDAFGTSGEPEVVSTWPATKLRWLARHQPEVAGAARHVLMIKDFVLLRLTGKAVGEETTRGFTYLYDVPARSYWQEMLDFCEVRPETLPELVPAGTDLGSVLPEVRAHLPAAASYRVNAGALDHFCTMLGTDTYRPGALSVSAGTVLSLSLLAEEWTFEPAMKVSFHPGLRPDETVLFSCADSGGVSLGWFRDNVAGDVDYSDLEVELARRDHAQAPVFLPYLTGLNPPDFNPAARGAFVDLQLRHDRVDLVYSVMEGVAHLLRRNLEDLAVHGHAPSSLVSAGGGTASPFWNQLKSDVCGLELRVPDESEAACRGAAVLALRSVGVIDSIDDTDGLHAPREHLYEPRVDASRDERFHRFESALQRLYGP